MMVQVQHIKGAGLCMRGARQWFAHHRLDFERFLREGLPIEEIEGTNDALGRLVCDTAREEADDGK